MADWDQNSPEDSDIVSQYPANARAARAAVRTNFGVDHHEQNDDDVGKHEVIQLVSQGSTPTIGAGQVGIWNQGGVLKRRTGTGAVQDLDVIPSGTVMLFFQASPPVGWSTAGGGVSGRLFNLVTTASGLGGTSTANSWTISGFTVAGHTLTTAQIPAHNHTASTGGAGGHNHGGSTGGAGSHNHGGSTGNRSPGTSSAGSHSHTQRARTAGGGSSDGSWYVSDGGSHQNASTTASAGAHSHTVNSHDHSISTVSNHTHSISTVSNHTHSVTVNNTGSGNSHSHGISHNGGWRPPVNNVIRAQKD